MNKEEHIKIGNMKVIPDNTVSITMVENGFIILRLSWIEDDFVSEEREVVEIFGSDVDSERKAFATVVEKLAYIFGEPFEYNKWKKDNLRISWDKKGSKI